ncbi:MAG: LCP family protein [Raoultibacter sp.]
MFGRRKGFSKSHFRNISRRVNTATLGSHVAKQPRRAGLQGSRDQLDFASRKRTNRALRGEINQVLPTTSSRESNRAHSRRVGQLNLADKATRHSKRKGIIIGVVVLLLITLAVAGVSTFTYVGSVSSKMALEGDSARSALVAPAPSDPYYLLLAAPFADAGTDDQQVDLMILARIDQAKKQVTLVCVPPNMEVTLRDGKTHPLREAYGFGGDAEVISRVSSFAGVPIAHYVKTSAAGLISLVDGLGGITVSVTEEVDDPQAGSDYIARGTQTLNGQQALTFCRARNFVKGAQTREDNQLAFTVALADKLLAVNTAALPATIDMLADCIKTDYSATDITGLIESMRGLDSQTIYTARVPGSTYVNADQKRLFTASSAGWKTMMEAVGAGKDPATSQTAAASSVDPQSFTITVRNGSDVTGLAAETTTFLTNAGFKVTETGNAESPVYTETLVIYKDAARSGAAQAVAGALGGGRVTDASSFYTFNTDILVMIGKDYTPTK